VFWREALIGDTFTRTTGEVLPDAVPPILGREGVVGVSSIRAGSLRKSSIEPHLGLDLTLRRIPIEESGTTTQSRHDLVQPMTAWQEHHPVEGGYIGPWSGGAKEDGVSPFFASQFSTPSFEATMIGGALTRNPPPDGCYDGPSGDCVNYGDCKKPKRCEFIIEERRCACKKPLPLASPTTPPPPPPDPTQRSCSKWKCKCEEETPPWGMSYPDGGREAGVDQSTRDAMKAEAVRKCKTEANAMCPVPCTCSAVQVECHDNVKILSPAEALEKYGDDLLWGDVVPKDPNASGYVYVYSYKCEGKEVACSKK